MKLFYPLISVLIVQAWLQDQETALFVCGISSLKLPWNKSKLITGWWLFNGPQMVKNWHMLRKMVISQFMILRRKIRSAWAVTANLSHLSLGSLCISPKDAINLSLLPKTLLLGCGIPTAVSVKDLLVVIQNALLRCYGVEPMKSSVVLKIKKFVALIPKVPCSGNLKGIATGWIACPYRQNMSSKGAASSQEKVSKEKTSKQKLLNFTTNLFSTTKKD